MINNLHIDIFQKLKTSTLLAFLFLMLPVAAFSQSGPGGVSNDSDPIKNCRLWLDAGDLSFLGDGNYVHVWKDKSLSVVDTAVWLDSFQEDFDAPLFRSDPAYSINGNPVVSFEDGGMLLMGRDGNNTKQNIDLTADGTAVVSAQRTVFIAFRTGNDVSTRQFLWEQGGGWKGLGIYIYNSKIYLGVYDLPGSGRQSFGHVYKTATVEPLTTYVVSLILDAPTNNTLDTREVGNTSLRGTINDGTFGILEQDISKPSIPGGGFGVGPIGHQGDPIGIGGVNSLAAHESAINDWYDASNPCVGYAPCNNTLVKPVGLTGQFTFKGRIAEICYYAYSLNNAERIIVENYLAAKYFANVIANDKFQYKANFGHDVIGIGAEFQDGTYQEHNVSKGDNLFEISVDNMTTAFKYGSSTSRYLLTGHNNNPLLWTNQNTPDSANVQRLRRTWRFDRSGTGIGDQFVKIRFTHPDSLTGLPQLPIGYKYAILIDDSNGPLPNFSTSSNLTEIVLRSAGWYEGDFNIPDGAYFTIAAVKPTIQFKKRTDFAIEGNPSPIWTSKTVEVELNYTPRLSGSIQAGVIFIPLSAENEVDFQYSTSNVSIPQLQKTGVIDFDIKNDEAPDNPPVKKFLIIFDPTVIPNGFFIGKRDTLTYSIYDDDSEPKTTFLSALNDTITEAMGTAPIEVLIRGNRESASSIRITNQNIGSAIYGIHYSLPSGDGWLGPDNARYKIIDFEAGSGVSKTIEVPIFNLGINDYDKTINFIIEPEENASVDDDPSISILEHTLSIKNINLEPTVEFLASNSEGFRAVSQPRIVVKLSSPSGKLIQVPFKITEASTAANGADQSNSDYTATYTGTVIFPPGITISYLYYDPETGNIPLQVYTGDGTGTMPPKTIEFKLQDAVINAGLGFLDLLNHTYTIKDYLPFEWEGAAGIGRLRDNTFWINLDGANLTAKATNIPQLSNRPIYVKQSTENRKPEIGLGENNQEVMKFNGSSFLEVSGSKLGQSPFINTSGFYDSKSIFFVVKPYNVSANPSTPQVIYEEGGMDKGLNIYIKNQRLYFQAWNISNDDGAGNLALWGEDNNSYAMSDILINDQTYVVSCHYNNTELDGATGSGLRIFVNGVEQESYGNATDQKIGRLYVHGEKIGIGGINDQTRFDNGPDNSPTGNYFKGEIGEMIYFNESGHYMNTARIRILHNYLSARFNVPLVSGQIYDLNYADQANSDTTYNKDVAGIGIVGPGDLHGIAQGTSPISKKLSQLKITGTSLKGTNKFLMWGHNDESFTNTWSFSYGNASLPGSVKERSGRVWRFSTNSGVSSIDSLTVEMNFSESSNASLLTNNRSLLKLLVSSDPIDWSNAAVYAISGTQPVIEEGARVIFDNVNIPNGSYIALGNTSPITVSPLPIELLDFTARFEVDHVNLRWITSTEHNNDYFVVERAGEDLKWNDILTVTGAGSSTTQLSYYQKDRNPLLGVSYYRLKQVDFDGTYTYSDVISVLNTNARDEDAVFMFPNPASSGSVFLRIPDATKVYDTRVRIFDLQGKVVWSGSFDADTNLLEIRYGDLNSGIYLVEIQSDVIYESKKLVIQ